MVTKNLPLFSSYFFLKEKKKKKKKKKRVREREILLRQDILWIVTIIQGIANPQCEILPCCDMQLQRLELELPPPSSGPRPDVHLRFLYYYIWYYYHYYIYIIIIIFFYKANRYTEPWGYHSWVAHYSCNKLEMFFLLGSGSRCCSITGKGGPFTIRSRMYVLLPGLASSKAKYYSCY